MNLLETLSTVHRVLDELVPFSFEVLTATWDLDEAHEFAELERNGMCHVTWPKWISERMLRWVGEAECVRESLRVYRRLTAKPISDILRASGSPRPIHLPNGGCIPHEVVRELGECLITFSLTRIHQFPTGIVRSVLAEHRNYWLPPVFDGEELGYFAPDWSARCFYHRVDSRRNQLLSRFNGTDENSLRASLNLQFSEASRLCLEIDSKPDSDNPPLAKISPSLTGDSPEQRELRKLSARQRHLFRCMLRNQSEGTFDELAAISGAFDDTPATDAAVIRQLKGAREKGKVVSIRDKLDKSEWYYEVSSRRRTYTWVRRPDIER